MLNTGLSLWRKLVRNRVYGKAVPRRRRDIWPHKPAAAVERLEDRTLLTTFNVTSFVDTVDINPGDGTAADANGNTTLRAAIMEANALAGDDTIQIGAGTVSLNRSGFNEDVAATGDLDILNNGSITITGAGAGLTTITAHGMGDRVFDVLAGASLTLDGLTIRNGSGVSRTGESQPGFNGGAIQNNGGSVVINDSVLTANRASNRGGGIYNHSGGSVHISGNIISENSANFGGGIYNTNPGSVVTITDSSLADNSVSSGSSGAGIVNAGGSTIMIITDSTLSGHSAGHGGGIFNSGLLTITGSTFSGNSASQGGGINNRHSGVVDITNSTFEGNSAGAGGAIHNSHTGSVDITGSTLSDNSAGSGGAIYNGFQGGKLTIIDSTLSGNTAVLGGAIRNTSSGGSGIAHIRNSTLSGNSADSDGGAIYNGNSGSRVNISNSTLTGNRADADADGTGSGGGLFNDTLPSFVTLNNTIVAGNLRGTGAVADEIGGTISTASSFNLIADAGTAGGLSDGTDGNIVATIPVASILDTTLADNGGPTLTHALVNNSPALDTGDPGFNDTSLTFDQRRAGFARVAGGRIDIGAYEALLTGVELVSAADPSLFADATGGELSEMSVSADGRYVVFTSDAANLAPGDNNATTDVFVRDLVNDTTELVSAAIDGGSGNSFSSTPAISADGRFVAFQSYANDLVSNDNDNSGTGLDVFVRDLVNNTTVLVSEALGGGSGNASSANPAISADGRFVAFQSRASNLVADDSDGTDDVLVRDLLNGTTELVSVATTSGSGDARSLNPVISADGRFVAFESRAGNLVVGDGNGTDDVFVRDLVNDTTALVSLATGGGSGNNSSSAPVISADGQFVVFESSASDLVAGDGNGAHDVFVHDLLNNTTELVSVATGGGSGDRGSSDPAISADGRFLAFTSIASDLAAGDTNGTNDIYVRDLMNNTTELVSVATTGGSGSSYSVAPVISADGRFVAFQSRAFNLVAGVGSGGHDDIYVRDLVNQTTELVSATSDGRRGDRTSRNPVISADGTVVAFESDAIDLVSDIDNGSSNIFARNLVAGSTELVSVRNPSLPSLSGNRSSFNHRVSADGRFVVFATQASNIVPGDNHRRTDVFVRDLLNDTSELVSVAIGGGSGNSNSSVPVISADGRFVVFDSLADNLVSGDNNNRRDVFVRDMLTGTTELVSVTTGGNSGNNHSRFAVISPDGRFVAFESFASDLAAGDNDGTLDVYVRDLANNTTTLASVAAGGGSGNGVSQNPVISADGRFVAFDSFASDLAPGDSNGTWDVFVRDLVNDTTELVSVATHGASGALFSSTPSISADGRLVAFESDAGDLVLGDGNGTRDVFIRDLVNDTTELISVGAGGGSANELSFGSVISADGSTVAFASRASDLVAGDSNGTTDVFVRDLANGTTELVSVATGGGSGNSRSQNPVISADGRFVAFDSAAGNLVTNDGDSRDDVFVRDLVNDRTVLASAAIDGGSGNFRTSDPVISANGSTVAFSSDASNLVAADYNGLRDIFAFSLNSAPEADVGGPYSVDEGANLTLVGSASSDPDEGNSTLTFEWNLDYDGLTFDVDATGETPAVSFPDNFTTRTIALRVTDSAGEFDIATTTLTVNNVAPTPNAGADQTVNEGDLVTLNGTFTDPGIDDGHKQEWSVVAGNGQAVSGLVIDNLAGDSDGSGGSSFGFTPNDNGTYTVSYTVTDDDGGTLTDTAVITVDNVAPTVEALSLDSATINEDGSVTVTGSLADAGTADTHSVVIEWGAGETSSTAVVTQAAGTFTATHQYLDDNPTATASDVYQIKATVTDDDGGSVTSAEASLTVNNADPTLVETDANMQEYVLAVGESAAFGGTFADDGTLDSHTVVWDFTYITDTATEVSISDSTAAMDQVNDSVSLTRSFDAAGVYTVTMTITDDDIGATTSAARTFVVYDPSAGFVTGGGWIDSPAGAYYPDATLTGKAAFGFNSKYKKGQSTPTGNTSFEFKVADLEFKSTSYDWLVVAGARAQYKAEGTINGAGNFGFLLTVIDGQVNGGGGTDKFRMKIWDKNNGDALIYDNALGASDDDAPPTALGGGSVIIHDNGKALHAAHGANGAGGFVTLTHNLLDPAVDQAISYWAAAGAETHQIAAMQAVDVQVADLSGSLLGMASASDLVWIDVDAAGLGWGGGAFDLVSVVSHELGHMIGLDDIGDLSDVMGASLSPGVSRLPDSQFVQEPSGPVEDLAASSFALFESDDGYDFESNGLTDSEDYWNLVLSEPDAGPGPLLDEDDEERMASSLNDEFGSAVLTWNEEDSDVDAVFADVQDAAWDELLVV